MLIAPSGFDNSTWDPFQDKFLPKNYSADDLEGKAICKVALQQHVGLPKDASVALVSIAMKSKTIEDLYSFICFMVSLCMILYIE